MLVYIQEDVGQLHPSVLNGKVPFLIAVFGVAVAGDARRQCIG